MKMLVNHPASKCLLAPTVALLLSITAHAAGDQPVFTMTVISDDSFGRLVEEGEYGLAIEKISSRGKARRNSFEAQTNLCVAYTKSGEMANASEACDAALASIQTLAERALKRRSTPDYLAKGYRAYLALALGNRGVVNAIRGDYAEARNDFLQASELQANLPAAAEVNLARLDMDR